MAAYPDPQFVNYKASGIQKGFQIGFQYGAFTAAQQKPTSLHPEPISACLKEELEESRIAGPFPVSQLPGMQCNKLGVIPKCNQGMAADIRFVISRATKCQ